MTQARSETVRVVVWMRGASPPPDDPRTAVLTRLRELEAAGLVDDMSVRVWGRYVAAPSESAEGTEHPIRDRIAEFRAWAEENESSLEPAFRRCERTTMVSETTSDVIRLPLQCLAVYEGDRLVEVVPRSTGRGTETVADCVSRLETGALVGNSSPG